MNIKLSKSKNANSNYLAKVVHIKEFRSHENADKLKIATVDFQDVIVSIDDRPDVYVYFPLECQIDSLLLSALNAYRDSTLNSDTDKVGFFEDNRRIKALKLRGEKSMGFMIPFQALIDFMEIDYSITPAGVRDYINCEFDTINGNTIMNKYITPIKNESLSTKKDKIKKLSRLVDNQVRLHVDTDNLRKNSHKIHPNDEISISYKYHGTSWWVGNLMVKRHWRDMNIIERISSWFGEQQLKYDIVYGSRKVVKNKSLEDPKSSDHFYGSDIWKDISDEVRDKIPKGYTLYGEAVGFTKGGGAIQGGYDYGCAPGEMKILVYRITITNTDGQVIELSHQQIEDFCNKNNLNMVQTKFIGEAIEWLEMFRGEVLDLHDENSYQESLIRTLELEYNEKDCVFCSNKVPEEGVVIRVQNLYEYNAFKLKSFRFLEHETKELDKGTENIEDNG